MFEKLVRTDENKVKIEEEKLAELEQRKIKHEVKTKEIKESIERKNVIADELRRAIYSERQARAESLQRKLVEEKEQERLIKIRQTEEKLEVAKIKQMNIQAEQELQTYEIYNRLQESFERADEQRKKIHDSKTITVNRMLEYIKQEEAKTNQHRQEKMKNYQEDKIRKRLEYHSTKMEMFHQEHMSIKREREEIQKMYNSKYESLKKQYDSELTKKQKSASKSPNHFASTSHLSSHRSGVASSSGNKEEYNSKSPLVSDFARSLSPNKIIEPAYTKPNQNTPKPRISNPIQTEKPTSPSVGKVYFQHKNQTNPNSQPVEHPFQEYTPTKLPLHRENSKLISPL